MQRNTSVCQAGGKPEWQEASIDEQGTPIPDQEHEDGRPVPKLRCSWKNGEIKGQKGFCKYIGSKGKAGKDMAPLLSLAGKAVEKDIDKAQVLNDWFALHLFLVFTFGFGEGRGCLGFLGGRGLVPGKVCLWAFRVPKPQVSLWGVVHISWWDKPRSLEQNELHLKV